MSKQTTGASLLGSGSCRRAAMNGPSQGRIGGLQTSTPTMKAMVDCGDVEDEPVGKKKLSTYVGIFAENQRIHQAQRVGFRTSSWSEPCFRRCVLSASACIADAVAGRDEHPISAEAEQGSHT
jgi:hypothetical protein